MEGTKTNGDPQERDGGPLSHCEQDPGWTPVGTDKTYSGRICNLEYTESDRDGTRKVRSGDHGVGRTGWTEKTYATGIPGEFATLSIQSPIGTVSVKYPPGTDERVPFSLCLIPSVRVSSGLHSPTGECSPCEWGVNGAPLGALERIESLLNVSR